MDYLLEKIYEILVKVYEAGGPTIRWLIWLWVAFVVFYVVLDKYDKKHFYIERKKRFQNHQFALPILGVAALTITYLNELLDLGWYIPMTQKGQDSFYQMIGGFLLLGIGLLLVFAGRLELNGYWGPDIYLYTQPLLHKKTLHYLGYTIEDSKLVANDSNTQITPPLEITLTEKKNGKKEEKKEETYQNIVTEGIYSKVKHPVYLGQILMFLGSSIVLNNFVILFIAGTFTIFNIVRIIKEERFHRLFPGGDKYCDETGFIFKGFL